MTRKRAEKLMTAAMCGRGRDARDKVSLARKMHPDESNAEILDRCTIALYNATSSTLIIMALDTVFLKSEKDKTTPSCWEACMRERERLENQIWAILNQTKAMRRQLAGGGA